MRAKFSLLCMKQHSSDVFLTSSANQAPLKPKAVFTPKATTTNEIASRWHSIFHVEPWFQPYGSDYHQHCSTMEKLAATIRRRHEVGEFNRVLLKVASVGKKKNRQTVDKQVAAAAAARNNMDGQMQDITGYCLRALQQWSFLIRCPNKPIDCEGVEHRRAGRLRREH